MKSNDMAGGNQILLLKDTCTHPKDSNEKWRKLLLVWMETIEKVCRRNKKVNLVFAAVQVRVQALACQVPVVKIQQE